MIDEEVPEPGDRHGCGASSSSWGLPPDVVRLVAVPVPPLVEMDPCVVDVDDEVPRALASAVPGAAAFHEVQRLVHRLAVDPRPDAACLPDAAALTAGAPVYGGDPLRAAASLSDAVLLEMVASCDRLLACVTAAQASAMGVFAARRQREAEVFAVQHPVMAQRGLARSTAVEELAARRRLTRQDAGRDLNTAQNLLAAPPVHGALSRGELDVPRARVIAGAASGVGSAHSERLVARVLLGAGRVRLDTVRDRCRRAAWALDPGSARAAAQQAAEHRSVFVTHAPGDPECPGGGGRAILEMDGPAADVLTVAAAIEARALAMRTRERQAATEQGRIAQDKPLASWRHDALVDIAASVLEGEHGPVQHSAASRPVVHVTVPAATLMGLSEEPGALSGALSGARGTFGPIPADQARAIAADATWRRILTDPSGRVLEVSERTYRPSTHLAALVRTDHPACSAPWCARDARECDLDHLVPWPGGPTSRANLHPACPRDHRIKHSELGITAHRDPSGAIVHTTRTGHRYSSAEPGEDTPPPSSPPLTASVAGATVQPIGWGHGDPPF